MLCEAEEAEAALSMCDPEHATCITITLTMRGNTIHLSGQFHKFHIGYMECYLSVDSEILWKGKSNKPYCMMY